MMRMSGSANQTKMSARNSGRPINIAELEYRNCNYKAHASIEIASQKETQNNVAEKQQSMNGMKQQLDSTELSSVGGQSLPGLLFMSGVQQRKRIDYLKKSFQQPEKTNSCFSDKSDESETKRHHLEDENCDLDRELSPVHGSGLHAVHKLKKKMQQVEWILEKGQLASVQNPTKKYGEKKAPKTTVEEPSSAGFKLCYQNQKQSIVAPLGSRLFQIDSAKALENLQNQKKTTPEELQTNEGKKQPSLRYRISQIDDDRVTNTSRQISGVKNNLLQQNNDALTEENVIYRYHSSSMQSGEQVLALGGLEEVKNEPISGDLISKRVPCANMEQKFAKTFIGSQVLNRHDSEHSVEKSVKNKKLQSCGSDRFTQYTRPVPFCIKKRKNDTEQTRRQNYHIQGVYSNKASNTLYFKKDITGSHQSKSNNEKSLEKLPNSSPRKRKDNILIKRPQNLIKKTLSYDSVNKGIDTVSASLQSDQEAVCARTSSLSSSLSTKLKYFNEKLNYISKNKDTLGGSQQMKPIGSSFEIPLSQATMLVDPKAMLDQPKSSNILFYKKQQQPQIEKSSIICHITKSFKNKDPRMIITQEKPEAQQNEMIYGASMAKQQLGFKAGSDLVSLPEIPPLGESVYGNFQAQQANQPCKVQLKIQNNNNKLSNKLQGKKRDRIFSRGSCGNFNHGKHQTKDRTLTNFQFDALEIHNQNQHLSDEISSLKLKSQNSKSKTNNSVQENAQLARRSQIIINSSKKQEKINEPDITSNDANVSNIYQNVKGDPLLMNIESARLDDRNGSQYAKHRPLSKFLPQKVIHNRRINRSNQIYYAGEKNKEQSQMSQNDNPSQSEYTSVASHRNRPLMSSGHQKRTEQQTQISQGPQGLQQNTRKAIVNSKNGHPTFLSDQILRGAMMQRNQTLSNQSFFLRSATYFKNMTQKKIFSTPESPADKTQPIRQMTATKQDAEINIKQISICDKETDQATKSEKEDTENLGNDCIQAQSFLSDQQQCQSNSQKVIQPLQPMKTSNPKSTISLQQQSRNNSKCPSNILAIQNFKPCQHAKPKPSFRVFKDYQDVASILETDQPHQCIALCLEGLCTIFRQNKFLFEDDQIYDQWTIYVRDSLLEALKSFRKATNGVVKLILYTYLNEESFDQFIVDKPGLKELWSGPDCQIERIIFISSWRLGSFEEIELAIPRKFLPQETQELLWVHPFDLEYHEILTRLKDKRYERLLCDSDALRFVNGLPYVAVSETEAEPVQPIYEYSLLVSSLDFDLETGQSASMLAIMKTVQSLYFLGKITHLISSTKLKKERRNNLLVPAVEQPGLVPAPARPATLQEKLLAKSKPVVTFSFQKSFKTVSDHMLLSLTAFKAPKVCFHSTVPVSSTTFLPKSQVLTPKRKPDERSNFFSFSVTSSYIKNPRQTRAEQLKKLPSSLKHYADPRISTLNQLETTAQILDLIPCVNSAHSISNFLYLKRGVRELHHIEQKEKQKAALTQNQNSSSQHQVATAQGQQQPFISYLQHTVSSQAAIVANWQDRSREDQQLPDRSNIDRIAATQMNGVSGVLSPRNTARQKMLRDLIRQNREIAKHIKQYSRIRLTQQKNQTAVTATNKQKPQNNEPETEDVIKNPQAEIAYRNVMVLDGWLINKYPLRKLPLN